MSYQEKRSIVHLASIVLILVVYGLFVLQRHPGADASTTSLFSFWGATILLLVPVQILTTVILHVIFSVINTVATKEDEPAFEDERDKVIGLKSLRNSYYVFMLGFLLAMGTLVVAMPPSVMFNVIVLSLFAGQIAWGISQFIFYRRGY